MLALWPSEMVEYLRELLLVKAGAAAAVELSAEALAEMEELVRTASLEQISTALKLFRQVDLEFDGFSTLPLELALVECALTEEEEETPPVARETPRRERAPAPTVVKESAPAAEAVPQAAAPTSETKQEFAEVSLPELNDDVEYLRSRWKDVVKATKGLGSSGNLDALLRSACEPVGLEDDTIVLGFYFQFHKEKIEDPKYRHMVENKVSEIFGKSYKIRCILTEKSRKAPEREQKAHGHLVDAALKMGARIVEEADE